MNALTTLKSNMLYPTYEYSLTNEEIKATGKVEYYEAASWDEAVQKAHYTHKLHGSVTPLGHNGGKHFHCSHCRAKFIVTLRLHRN